MSLFGEEDPSPNSPFASPSPSKRPKSSLFDNETHTTPTRKSAVDSNLFADDPTPTSTSNEEPWTFTPSSKSRTKASLVKTLLDRAPVPEMYIDVFDALAHNGKVDEGSVRRVVGDAGIKGVQADEIVRTVGQKELGRGEFNVLLALVGLAAEGEDVTLDGVDERRANLPVPKLNEYAPKKGENVSLSQTSDGAGEGGEFGGGPVKRQSTLEESPSRNRGSQRQQSQSYGFPDTDPWGSPEMHRGHNHASGTNGNHVASKPAAAERTTSDFTTPSVSVPDLAASPPAANAAGLWGGYTSPSIEPGLGGLGGVAGFGAGDDGPGETSDLTGLGAPLPRISPNGPEEVVTVTSLPEKEGMFLFQHRNYQVTSARRNSKVIRRYSDFAWLLDCLHKRYPFRQLPLLPPKRIGINGNYLAADATFVEKRRRGLVRFTNALVRHPVLAQEQLVIMFLTVPTELAVWRKQASITIQEEFLNKPLPPTLEDSLPQNLQSLFDRVRTGVRRSAEQYINLCNSMERMVKRNEGLAAEYLRISGALQTLTSVSADTYASDSGEMLALNMGVSAAARHYDSSRALVDDEGKAWEEGVLEDLKKQRDGLVSVRDMFDRRERLDRDNIPALERRIQGNEEKLVGIRNKPEGLVKPGEAERVEDAILKDKKSIVDQHARGVFIKECIKDEIAYFQTSQFQISRLHQDWAAERVKYAELQVDNWRALAEEVESMPLGE